MALQKTLILLAVIASISCFPFEDKQVKDQDLIEKDSVEHSYEDNHKIHNDKEQSTIDEEKYVPGVPKDEATPHKDEETSDKVENILTIKVQGHPTTHTIILETPKEDDKKIEQGHNSSASSEESAEEDHHRHHHPDHHE